MARSQDVASFVSFRTDRSPALQHCVVESRVDGGVVGRALPQLPADLPYPRAEHLGTLGGGLLGRAAWPLRSGRRAEQAKQLVELVRIGGRELRRGGAAEVAEEGALEGGPELGCGDRPQVG